MLFVSPPLLSDIELSDHMSRTTIEAPSQRMKLDVQFLLACLTAWRANHDPVAGWALITAARYARGKEKQAAFRFLEQMLEFDGTSDNEGPQQMAAADFEIETQTWKQNRAEIVASGDLR